MPKIRDKASVSCAVNVSRSSEDIEAVEVVVSCPHTVIIALESCLLCIRSSPQTWSLPEVHESLGDDETGNVKVQEFSNVFVLQELDWSNSVGLTVVARRREVCCVGKSILVRTPASSFAA